MIFPYFATNPAYDLPHSNFNVDTTIRVILVDQTMA